MAAVLAAGGGAVLSHRDAAALWGIRPDQRSRIDVTVGARRRNARGKLQIHRPRRFGPELTTIVNGIPVTNVPRTILDLADLLPLDALAAAIETADRLDLLDFGQLRSLLASARGRRGLPRLRKALETYAPEPAFTRSALEHKFLEFCRRRKLPVPLPNHYMEGREVDFVWERQRLVVETDGWEYHRTRAAFERDRARDTELMVAGYRVARITFKRLASESVELEQQLRTLLGLQAPGHAGDERATGHRARSSM